MLSEQDQKDLDFLRDMSRSLEEGDIREVETMISDWIDELEKKEVANA